MTSDCEKLIIENPFLSVTVKRRGAELCGITGADGTRYLWRADPAVWPRHAPILFPIIGRLAGDSYSVGERRFSMGRHGFARDADFEVLGRDQEFLLYRLRSSPETMISYPFPFILEAGYKLNGAELTAEYRVTNPGSEVLPFSIGAHPAFSCEWEKDDSISRYFLEFEKEEDAKSHILRDGLLSDETEHVLQRQKILNLTGKLFDRDALIFKNLSSRTITLRRNGDRRAVTVKFPEFTCLGIWSKPSAPFVCIEPWFGHTDPVSFYGDFLAKPGLIRLPAGKSFNCKYSMVILSPGREKTV